MTDLGKRSNTLLIIVVVSSSIVSVLLALFGATMVYLGATGRSDVKIFGNSVSSENVGIPAIVVSGVVATILLRRTLTSHDSVLESMKGIDSIGSS